MLLVLNTNFYQLQSVKNAVRAFKGLAGFEVQANKKTIKVKIKNIDKEVKDNFEDEFCNYVLAEVRNVKKT